MPEKRTSCVLFDSDENIRVCCSNIRSERRDFRHDTGTRKKIKKLYAILQALRHPLIQASTSRPYSQITPTQGA